MGKRIRCQKCTKLFVIGRGLKRHESFCFKKTSVVVRLSSKSMLRQMWDQKCTMEKKTSSRMECCTPANRAKVVAWMVRSKSL